MADAAPTAPATTGPTDNSSCAVAQRGEMLKTMLSQNPDRHLFQGLVLALMSCLLLLAGCRPGPASLAEDPAKREWRVYGGDAVQTRYSPLDQINTSNVKMLQRVWTYHTGDLRDGERGEIQCNPIVVDGVLYGSSPHVKIFALNAATGEEMWRFDPFADVQEGRQGRHRGVTYWADGDDKRILFTAGPHLFALNAKTGAPIRSFGTNGRVPLDTGLGRDLRGLHVDATSPGIVYRDLLILGSRVSEGPESAPGHIRAFDVRTGALRWIFHTIPHPGEFGYDTWPPDAWQKTGGTNCWAGMSLDSQRGIVYVPTGSPAYDFYGGNRKGAGLFGNSLLALDAKTGKRLWHFQTVHHDVWDRDLPAPPNLVTLRRNGRTIDAVAQITKSGFVFVFERETGEPLFPIEEKPYPPSDLYGEETWPTQPLPTKPPPFARQIFREPDITDLTPQAHREALARLRQVRSAGQFIPPSKQGTMIFPGFDGGAEWGGAAVDPSGILYVNANEMPWILTMVDVQPVRGSDPISRGRHVYVMNCASCHGIDREGDAEEIYPPLTDLRARMNRKELFELLDSSSGAMPAFRFLSPAHRAALAAYLFATSDAVAQTGAGAVDRAVTLPEIPYVSTGYFRFLDHEGYPAIKPPWGTLTAIDLNTGDFVWQVRLGEFAKLTARGIPQTGTENYGGPITTAGGLLFIGATKDEKFRAFDKSTGEVLWETQLPAGGYATPCTYEVAGRQYVVIAAGGGKMGTKSGDSYVAFALPK